MACSSSLVLKDFVDINGRPLSSSSDHKNSSVAAINVDHQNELFIGGSSLKLRQGMFQPTNNITLDLFQKKTSAGKSNHIAGNKYSSGGGDAGGIIRKDESRTRTSMTDTHQKEYSGGGSGGGFRRGTVHVPWGSRDYYRGSSRPPTLLEQSLFPAFKKHVRLPIFPSSGEQAAETAQMTIFYAGNVNVYDNVPADKACAVMVLASQYCVAPDPADSIVQDATTVLDLTAKTPPPSLDNSTEGLPLARQQSLRRFLEKRRGRMLNKFPYAKLDNLDCK